jgi:predicted metal-binding protein
MPQHVMSVCTSCASAHRTKQPIRKSGGERLLEQLQTLHQRSPLETFSIQPAECLGACEQDCTIAFNAPGKHIYLFGNLPVDDEQLASTAAAVMTFAGQYHAKFDGTISYLKCPELLKKRVLAKIPPLSEELSNFGGE